MLALFSTPLRRWLLAALLLPALATGCTKLGRYLQRRNGGVPTVSSRVLLALSSVARRFSRTREAAVASSPPASAAEERRGTGVPAP